MGCPEELGGSAWRTTLAWDARAVRSRLHRLYSFERFAGIIFTSDGKGHQPMYNVTASLQACGGVLSPKPIENQNQIIFSFPGCPGKVKRIGSWSHCQSGIVANLHDLREWPAVK